MVLQVTDESTKDVVTLQQDTLDIYLRRVLVSLHVHRGEKR